MIDRIYGTYYFVCDVCGEESEAEFKSFDEAVDGREDIGWSGKWEKDGWKDIYVQNARRMNDERD